MRTTFRVILLVADKSGLVLRLSFRESFFAGTHVVFVSLLVNGEARFFIKCLQLTSLHGAEFSSGPERLDRCKKEQVLRGTRESRLMDRVKVQLITLVNYIVILQKIMINTIHTINGKLWFME